MRTLIMILCLTVTGFAHAGITKTLVCNELADLKAVITKHVTEGDREAVQYGVDLIEKGKCQLAMVTMPDNPALMSPTYAAMRGETDLFIAISLINGKTALIWLKKPIAKTGLYI